MPSNTHTADRKNAAMYGARDGRRCIDCRTAPTDWRSSFAARWGGLTSSAAAGAGARPTVSAKNRSSSIGGALRLGRRRAGRSAATSAVILANGSAAGAVGGAGSDARGATGGSSRRLSASWIAAIAAAVGSCILFGLFAITVRVLNSLQGIAARTGLTRGPHASCAEAAKPLPFGRRDPRRKKQDTAARAS